ncbi:tyrosine-type recombinase/integrase [Streptomyces sp. P6-2-1]|uniref:tyrosine-type recombinase/integrase n=1 Tax=Streptomyces sp. P6-2-1 TaxID=3422591 RepID=UPI003D3637E5
MTEEKDVSAVRREFLSEFRTHLRASTNKQNRPYSEKTITAYCKAVERLTVWMEEVEYHGDYLTLDAPTLNTFFRTYFNEHEQGGTNTVQRNLRNFFNWLEEEYDTPHPYKDRRFQRYAPIKGAKPKTLSTEFVADMLKTVGNGHPRIRDFERLRDYAMMRVLTEGVRAEELLSLRIDSLFLEQGLMQVVPLKEARAAGEGRIVPLQPKTVIALKRYIRARESHKLSRDPWLWLGTRGRAKLTYSGLYRMLKRRAEEAGYEGVGAHAWRHMTANELLESGVQETDVMTLLGWKDPTMLRVYAADMATGRAVKVARAMGDRH